MMQCPHCSAYFRLTVLYYTEEKLITCGKTILRKFGKSLYRMYIHKIKIPYQFLSGYSGFYLCSKKKRCLKTFISRAYFEALFWVCVRPTFCVPPLKMGGGTKSDDFGVCVSVPSQIFWSVPANGIKRVGDTFFSKVSPLKITIMIEDLYFLTQR